MFGWVNKALDTEVKITVLETLTNGVLPTGAKRLCGLLCISLLLYLIIMYFIITNVMYFAILEGVLLS